MKNRIPKFHSVAEERQFWQTHSATEFLDELTPVTLKFVKPRNESVSVKLTGLEVRILQGVLARLTGARARPHTPAHRKG